MENIPRRAPKRTLSKEEAARHLIHSAIRMIGKAEDPYAIHMLVQSADKLLTDLSDKLNKPLTFSWVEYAKPERVKDVLKILRETYNFFKHADKDHDQELGVINIVQFNVVSLALCAINFYALFGYWTDHMKAFHLFAGLAAPDIFVQPANREEYEKRSGPIRSDTPSEFFQNLFERQLYKDPFGDLEKERREDLKDNEAFYDTAISELPGF